MKPLLSKVALVTGGASGIGAATASLLAERGATVMVADLVKPAVTAASPAPAMAFVKLDVTSETDWAAAIDGIREHHGRLDILVNAAGIVGDVLAGTLAQTTLADWRKVMAVNLDGTFLGCREAMPLMKKGSEGSIINVASVGAYYPTLQNPAYGASKAGVTQLTKTVAMYGSLEGGRVRCNSVHPGRTATPMLESIASQLAQRTHNGRATPPSSASRIPLGPSGTPQDAAALIAFLASAEAGYITGAEFVVDGGWRLLR